MHVDLNTINRTINTLVLIEALPFPYICQYVCYLDVNLHFGPHILALWHACIRTGLRHMHASTHTYKPVCIHTDHCFSKQTLTYT
jgi:fructose/tagatose bisphosphate aldolase